MILPTNSTGAGTAAGAEPVTNDQSRVDDNNYIQAEEGHSGTGFQGGEGGDGGRGEGNENDVEDVGAESSTVKSDEEIDKEELGRIVNIIRNEEQEYDVEEKRAIEEGKDLYEKFSLSFSTHSVGL